jgi:8-oxo-dGTP diphosphatase
VLPFRDGPKDQIRNLEIPGSMLTHRPGMTTEIHQERMTTLKLTLVVACALVDADKRVLIAQRPAGKTLAGLWEFPGGKVEPGERPEVTLIRELREEIGITVEEPCLAPLTFASHAYETFHLLMPLYICRRWEGLVVAREGQNLAWVRANKLRDYPMPPADIPLIPHLEDLLL